MGKTESLEQTVRRLAENDSTYAEDAYFLVYETVTYAQAEQEIRRHLCAAELLESLLELAGREYGPLAGRVLDEWGLRKPEDVGNIVYKLIGAHVLSASPDDSPENFKVLTRWFAPEKLMPEYSGELPRVDL